MSITRSMLFAPGNHARRMEKTLELPVDAVILDLEDAVAIAEKPAARKTVVEWLQRPRGAKRGFVRINALSTPFAFGDIEAVVGPGIDGIVQPKVESASELQTADYIITHYERERGLTPGAIEVMPIVETALGIDNIREIVRAVKRVKKVSFGGGDFSNDTGTPWIRDNALLLWARSQVVIASRAAGLQPPVDSVFARLADEEGFVADTKEARNMGFQGKMLIHPKQIDTINATFSPSPEEIEQARQVCDAFDEAERNGSSAIVVNGIFVDYPVVYRARQVLDTATQLGLLTAAVH